MSASLGKADDEGLRGFRMSLNPLSRVSDQEPRMRFSRVAKRRSMPSRLGALSKSQSGRDHVRRSDEPLGYSVFGLSRHAMAFWCAMGVEGSLAQYRICRRHPAMSFSSIVLGCMRRLWAGRDSHLCAGADLDCFGIAYGHFGDVLLLQIRTLTSARHPAHISRATSGGSTTRPPSATARSPARTELCSTATAG